MLYFIAKTELLYRIWPNDFPRYRNYKYPYRIDASHVSKCRRADSGNADSNLVHSSLHFQADPFATGSPGWKLLLLLYNDIEHSGNHPWIPDDIMAEHCIVLCRLSGRNLFNPPGNRQYRNCLQ